MTTNNIKLIDGIFNVEDATELLQHILNEKIKYHQQRIFSLSERFDLDDTHSRKRISELRDSKLKLFELVNLAGLNNKNLKIKSHIQIELVSEKPTALDSEIFDQKSILV